MGPDERKKVILMLVGVPFILGITGNLKARRISMAFFCMMFTLFCIVYAFGNILREFNLGSIPLALFWTGWFVAEIAHMIYGVMQRQRHQWGICISVLISIAGSLISLATALFVYWQLFNFAFHVLHWEEWIILHMLVAMVAMCIVWLPVRLLHYLYGRFFYRASNVMGQVAAGDVVYVAIAPTPAPDDVQMKKKGM
jgi:hypothetical protein